MRFIGLAAIAGAFIALGADAKTIDLVCLSGAETPLHLRIDDTAKSVTMDQGNYETLYVDHRRHGRNGINIEDTVVISDDQIKFGEIPDVGFGYTIKLNRYNGVLISGHDTFQCEPGSSVKKF